MFVRVRQSARRLQLSLVDTRRVGGKVHHEHVAGLGSIRLPPSPADRIEFWTRLHERLAKLGNRIGAAEHKIMADVHARIPMPTPDDQRGVQLENAKSDADFWGRLHDMHVESVDGQKGVITRAERAKAESEAGVALAADRGGAAKDRVARIERGEDVPGGLSKLMTAKDIMTSLGWTLSHMRRVQHVHEICEGDDAKFEELLAEMQKRREAGEDAAVRAMLKRRRSTRAT